MDICERSPPDPRRDTRQERRALQNSCRASDRRYVYDHQLPLQVFLQAVMAALAPKARLPHAAKRRNLCRDEASVNPYHPILKCLGHAICTRRVASIHVGRKTSPAFVGELYRLLFGLEADDRCERAKGLLSAQQ